MEDGSKLYYTIGEVSKILGESTSLVRFWSDNFPQFIKPTRNKKGNRYFTVKDVETFKMIHHLVKESGMTLEGARQRMKQNLSPTDRKLEVIERLRSIKAKLLAVSEDLEGESDAGSGAGSDSDTVSDYPEDAEKEDNANGQGL